MFKDIGWPELLILLVIVMLIFGAGKMPSIARDLGRSITEFRKASKGGETDAEKEETKKAELKSAETSETKDKVQETKSAETAETNDKAKETRYIHLN